MKHEDPGATFFGVVDLAAAQFGGRALFTTDDFFAEMQNLLAPGRGVFVEGKFTERGKWMDGWESRRKRTAGHDSCVIELGAPGEVMGFDIDTHHFVGNHPPFASVEGLSAPPGASRVELARMTWRELLPQSPLRPDAQNLFFSTQRSGPAVTHVRLHIYPDGGVARFRVYGRVASDLARADAPDVETKAHLGGTAEGVAVDLAALKNGALALACSDAFFGPMNNLLLPGRADNMGGGWETRRKRQPGHDWILVKLAARGVATLLEVDTNHFKGNYPDRCSVEFIDDDTRPLTELVRSSDFLPLLPETKLEASQRHFFPLHEAGQPATHVRLNIFPDGGVSRLRVWGTPHG